MEKRFFTLALIPRLTSLITIAIVMSAAPADALPRPDRLNASSEKLKSGSAPELQPMLSQSTAAELHQTGDTISEWVSIKTKVFGGSGGADCWGWTSPVGTPYAIMGIHDGVVFVNAYTGQTYKVEGPTGYFCNEFYIWRDIKTYKHYCYIASECTGTNEGIMIVDMQYLPDSVHYVRSVPVKQSVEETIYTSHNISIDTVKGKLYAELFSPLTPGVRILNLEPDPENPSNGGLVPSGLVHDVFAHNDTIYLAQGNSNYSIWVNSNPLLAPVKIAELYVPGTGYSHNVWPTADRKHMITTDETVNRTVKIWNIEDLSNIYLEGEYLGPNALAHNAHVERGILYLSHYAAGVRIINIDDPTNPYEIASFSTYPDSTEHDYVGCWGVFPHTSNGLVYASTLEDRLYVLKDSTYVIGDTMSVLEALGNSGATVRVSVFAKTTLRSRNFTVPFSWAGPLDLTFDSASTHNTRTENFDLLEMVAIDAVGKSAVMKITSAANGSSINSIEEGEGAILNLYFTMPQTFSSESNPISLGFYGGSTPQVAATNGFIISPDYLSGSVSMCDFGGPDSDADGISDSCDTCPLDPLDDNDLDGVCGDVDNCATYNPDQADSDGDGVGDPCDLCPGFDDSVDSDSDGVPDACDGCPTIPDPCPCCDVPGDANGDGTANIGDATFLIAHIFSASLAPPCDEEGDADGEGSVNIGDVSYLIAFIFSGGPDPVCGP